MTSKSTPDGSASQSGDLVRLDFDLWSETGGKTELVDTTHEEVAQNAGVTGARGVTWGPRPHQIGGEMFPAGIEKALVGLKVGEEVEREFAPADAFGERDPDLIELFSMHEIERLPEMRREDAHLDLGTVLTINGRRGRVVTLTAARVRVDFNPPLAGRKLRGKFRIVERIAEPADQVRAIVELQYGFGSEFHFEVRGSTVTVKVPDRTKFDRDWIAAKARIVEKVRGQLHPETIRFVEEWATPTPAAAAPKEAKETAEPMTPKEGVASDAPTEGPKPAASATKGSHGHAGHGSSGGAPSPPA